MSKNIIELLIQGRIDEAEKLIEKYEDVPPEIDDWVWKSGSITLYTLALKKLIKMETIEEHDACSYLMSMPLCFYNDAYSLALYHARGCKQKC